eukprot:gene21465-28438_t
MAISISVTCCLLLLLLAQPALGKKKTPEVESNPACKTYVMGEESKCTTAKAAFGLRTTEACAEYCQTVNIRLPTGDPNNFCFDFSPSSYRCGCSLGPSAGEDAPGVTKYFYKCTTANTANPYVGARTMGTSSSSQNPYPDGTADTTEKASPYVQTRVKSITFLVTLCNMQHSMGVEGLAGASTSASGSRDRASLGPAAIVPIVHLRFGVLLWTSIFTALPASNDATIANRTFIRAFIVDLKGRWFNKYAPVDAPKISTDDSKHASPMNFDSSLCGENELYGWADFAESKAIAAGIDVRQYPHLILMLPDNNACNWRGIAMQSCSPSGRCVAWLNADAKYLSLDYVLHELGHNLGILHSSRGGNPYGDSSCIMGDAAGLRCYNAPQTYALGWSKEVADIGENSLVIVKWAFFQVPAVATHDTNFLRLQRDITGLAYTLYVSYRDGSGYDFQLQDKHKRKLQIHKYSVHLAKDIDTELPELLEDIPVDGHWPETPGEAKTSKVVVMLLSVSGSTATVALCLVGAGDECGTLGKRRMDLGLQIDRQLDYCVRDGVCDAGETAENCPLDCVCGNGVCDGSETVDTCPDDCAVHFRDFRCGDGMCEADSEDCFSCPDDCAVQRTDSLDVRMWHCCGGAANGHGCEDPLCSFLRPDGLSHFQCKAPAMA